MDRNTTVYIENGRHKIQEAKMKIKRKPEWLNKKTDFKQMHSAESELTGTGLHTVCHQARCPNISECFAKKTATFLILGDKCTRQCLFCNVTKGVPGPVEAGEAKKVIESAEKLGLKFLVVTSVTRDDLADGGASAFAEVIRKAREWRQETGVEVLVPDFKGDEAAVKAVVDAGPDVFAHNVEVVPSLYYIRKGAVYERSLQVLKMAKDIGAKRTKSGIMLGLGEKEYEVLQVFRDLREAGVDYLSIGQYLRPSLASTPVVEYIKPEIFDCHKEKALEMGFSHVESGPYVRSSYMAEKYNQRNNTRQEPEDRS
ncbi:MAG: lipoyl synthase [Spirochaetia bacterium]|nr:lipoyl synthase [Spirochaetia bacterium]